jgi:hypothetical protein
MKLSRASAAAVAFLAPCSSKQPAKQQNDSCTAVLPAELKKGLSTPRISHYSQKDNHQKQCRQSITRK